MPSTPRAHAFSPGSVGNIGVGFDLFGHTIAAVRDEAIVTRTEQPGVRLLDIRGSIEGIATIPRSTETNTAARAVQALCDSLSLPFGFEIELIKGIPLNAGLGGSASSAVAALVAANALLDTPLSREALIPLAVEGEFPSSQSRQTDNVAPMLLGGVVFAFEGQVQRFELPATWHAAVARPHISLRTLDSRQVLREPFGLDLITPHCANLTRFVLGLERCDATLIAAGLRDVLVEPRRAALIPNFHAVQAAALEHGALGCSISGAGPSVFAWFTDADRAHAAASAMAGEFTVPSDTFVTPINGIRAERID